MKALETSLSLNVGDSSHIQAKLAQARAGLRPVVPAAAPAAAANPFGNLAAMMGGMGGGGNGGANPFGNLAAMMGAMGGAGAGAEADPFGGMDLGALLSNPAISQMYAHVLALLRGRECLSVVWVCTSPCLHRHVDPNSFINTCV